MHAAVLRTHGDPPEYGEFPDPTPGQGETVVDVAAAGVHHLDLAKASGAFYTGPPPLPSVAGSDGVGRTADGRRVFFDETVSPYGSWAEQALVPAASLLDVAEGVDDALAAALGNTGLAAWLSLSWRAQLQPGETVLVLGATGALGDATVQAAKALGAGRVVAVGLEHDRLEVLRGRGADAAVELGAQDDLAAAFREATAGGADVTIDALWGDPAVAALKAAAHGARHIQLGHMAGVDAVIPATAVRAAAIDIRGFAVFHAPVEVRRDAYRALTEHAARGEITIDVEPMPLADVQIAVRRQRAGAGSKLVLIP
jgi:NADPH:quinone reductase-like Zn-dependent oxidoreductase